MPMPTADGALNNTDELRAELEAHGHTFRSRSDTEVILQGYAAWGEAVVERLRGKFAFALFDQRRWTGPRVLLARDGLGIKPLYYARMLDAFVVASEIKALVVSGLLGREIDAPCLVIVFEPDPDSFDGLSRYVALNGLIGNVELRRAVVGCEDGLVAFADGRGSESRVAAVDGVSEGLMVWVVHLYSVLRDGRLDVLKIDVEGYEELLLQGARGLLSDHLRRPRAIYIEVHPYAWSEPGTTSESLLNLLQEHACATFFLTGQPVEKIDRYDEIIAVNRSSSNPYDRKPT